MNIIVTGASRGIGFETALLFAADPGNRVFAISRNREGLECLQGRSQKEGCRGEIKTCVFDLANGSIQHGLIPEIKAFLPVIDILINNAGQLVNKPYLELTAKEFDLLHYFLRHPRQVLRREQILQEVWGYELGDDNVLEVYVGYLRRKLEAGGEPRLIQTVRAVGYVLREE